MPKILKVSGIVLGVVVLLILAAAVALPLLVDANDFKPRIVAAVEETTGRQLEIPGDIELSVFPWLGVDLGEVRLGNAPGFGEQPFASVKAVQVRVKLIPLLAKKLEIGKIIVEQPVIRLARNAKGVANWEDLTAAEEQASASEPVGETTTSPADISLDGLEIRNAHVVYTDAVAGTAAELRNFDVEAGNIGFPADFPVTLRGTLKLSQPQVEGAFEFHARVAAALDAQQYTLADGQLTFDVQGEGLPVTPLNGELSWRQMAADMAAGTAQLEGLALRALGVSVTGNASASGLGKSMDVKGEIKVAEFSPGQLLVHLGQELPATADGEVLDKASLSARFAATDDSVAIDDIQLVLDQSKLVGNVAVTNFAKPAARFTLSLDQLDLDRYLPAVGDQSADDEAADGASLDDIRIPADLVRGQDVTGQLTIGKLKAFGFKSSDVKIGIRMQDDALRVHPAQASFYGGGYSGDLRLDASGEVPVVSVDEHVQRIQLAPLVKDVLAAENLSGTAAMDVAATARGATVGGLRKTLNGTFSLDIRDGAVEGFNLWESVREAYAKFKGRTHESNAPARTEFAELAASGTIEKGVLRNDDLVAKLPFLRIKGEGEIDIAAATMDYTVHATVLKSPELADGIEELTGTAIPVRLSGPLTAPKVRPDVKGVLEAKAREALTRKERQLREEAERKEQELRDKAKQEAEEEKKRLEDKLKDRLKDFLG